MPRDPSRWWYALLPFPALVGFRYVLVGVTVLLLPTAGPGRSEALPVLLPGVAAALVGALAVVAAPLFAAAVLLDVRTLRNRSSWTPHWGYGMFGAVPLLGLFEGELALASIPATIAYLGLRRRRVGFPLGRGQPADAASTTGVNRWGPRVPTSRWWYGIVIPPALELTGGAVLWTVRTTGLLRGGSDPLTLLVPVALVPVAVGLVPLFAVSLYLDAKAVRNGSGDAAPDPRIWGLTGLGSLVGLVLFRFTFMPLIALAYGVRRRTTDAR